MKYGISKEKGIKCARSQFYNFNFNMKTGYFERWGKNWEDDPESSIYPEILDIEICTICNGVPDKNGVRTPCGFCYKSNGPVGKYMKFEDFKTLFDKLESRHTTQIALGSDAQCKNNPDVWKIMQYCRDNNVIPNITIADIDNETADNISKYCGACAVSRYANKDICYDSVKKLVDRGMTQVNIHNMIYQESYDQTLETISDMKTDIRLKGMNALVLLSLKKKGRGIRYNSLPIDKFKILVDKCFEEKINFGFDSCGCNKFLEVIKDRPDFENLKTVSEPCESSLFSFFASVDGEFFPCSFCDGIEGWEKGIDIKEVKDFGKDVWNNERVVKFRKKLLENKRNCPYYKV